MESWLQIFGLVALFALIAIAPFWATLKRAWTAEAQAEQTQAEQEALLDEAEAILAENERLKAQLLSTQPGALVSPNGQAHTAPPTTIGPLLDALFETAGRDPYSLPIGWEADSQGKPLLLSGSLHGDDEHFIGNVLITAMSRWGKNILEFWMTIALLYRATPRQLRIFYLDGKGPDGALLEGLAHNWQPPVTTEAGLKGALDKLDSERQRRMDQLKQHKVTKWEELPEVVRPPLLWVVINELSLLEKALGKDLEPWLEQQLSSALGAGMRYCIVTHTVANWDTGWRRHFNLMLAGGQISPDADQPNIGLNTKQIEAQGVVPPSKLASRGTFTARYGRAVTNVSIGFIQTAYRKHLLAALPKEELRPATTSHAPVSVANGAVLHAPPTIVDRANAGEPLSDDDIRALLHLGWSRTRIATCKGMVGENRKRLGRIDAIIAADRTSTDGLRSGEQEAVLSA